MMTKFKNLGAMKAEPVQWLWRDRIPLGSLTVLDGDPGCGKSALTYDLAARVTSGLDMPDGTPNLNPGGVVLLQGEDDPVSRVLPAIVQAGGDANLVNVVDQSPGCRISLPEDLIDLEEIVVSTKAKLLVIDPLAAFLAGSTNGNANVRQALGPVAALSKRHKLAVIVVRHLTKRTGGNPLYRGLGSIGIIGMARSGLAVGKSPNVDAPYRYVLAASKSNIRAATSLQYSTVLTESQTIGVRWLGEIDCGIQDFCDSEPRQAKATMEAKRVLLDLLEDGPVPAKVIIKAAKDAGISKRTLDRAKLELGIASDKKGSGVGSQWYWLPCGLERLSDWDVEQPQSHDGEVKPQS